jgi:hypothetical protein
LANLRVLYCDHQALSESQQSSVIGSCDYRHVLFCNP